VLSDQRQLVSGRAQLAQTQGETIP
jgi:hypothetical protein